MNEKKWTVIIEQERPYEHIESTYIAEILAMFDTVEEAKQFATLALNGCKDSTATITYEATNKKEEETE